MTDKQASTISEFCARYGISRKLAYKEVKRGKLRMFKVGARSLILIGDEQNWLTRSRTHTSGDMRAPSGKHRRPRMNAKTLQNGT